MRPIWIPLLFLLTAPSAVAVGLGTETTPEIVDPEGDIRYHATYTGAKNENHLDVVAAWFEHDALNDRIAFTIKVVDAERLASPPEDWQINCDIRGNVTDGSETVGELALTAEKVPGKPFGGVVQYRSIGQQAQSVEIPSVFTADYGSPGFYRLSWERNEILLRGVDIRNAWL